MLPAKALRDIRESVRYNGLKNDLGKKDFDAAIQKALEKVNAGGDSVGCIDPGTGKHELSGEVGAEAGGDAAPVPPGSGCRSLLNLLQAPSHLAAVSSSAPELAARRSSRDTVAARSGALISNMSHSFAASNRNRGSQQTDTHPQQSRQHLKRKKEQ